MKNNLNNHSLKLSNVYMKTVEEYLDSKKITPDNLLKTVELFSADKILHSYDYKHIPFTSNADNYLHCGCDVDDWYMHLLFEKQIIIDDTDIYMPHNPSYYWTLPITDKIGGQYDSKSSFKLIRNL